MSLLGGIGGRGRDAVDSSELSDGNPEAVRGAEDDGTEDGGVDALPGAVPDGDPIVMPDRGGRSGQLACCRNLQEVGEEVNRGGVHGLLFCTPGGGRSNYGGFSSMWVLVGAPPVLASLCLYLRPV